MIFKNSWNNFLKGTLAIAGAKTKVEIEAPIEGWRSAKVELDNNQLLLLGKIASLLSPNVLLIKTGFY